MTRVGAAILLLVGVFVLGGPAFGLAGLAAGMDVVVRGGPARVVFDLVVGSLLVRAGIRSLSSRRPTRAPAAA